MRAPHIRTSARIAHVALAALVSLTADACRNGTEPAASSSTGSSFKLSPCSATGTLQLAVAAATTVDCSNGGSTVTLAGNGASYLVVAQLAAGNVANSLVPYRLITDSPASASIASSRSSLFDRGTAFSARSLPGSLPGSLPAAVKLQQSQRSFDRLLRGRARQQLASGAWKPAFARARASRAANVAPVPALGSIRQFRVLSSATGMSFSNVGARLSYAGSNILVYLDTLTPSAGFTAAQLQSFGALFDSTLYPIDTAAFGQPSDIDGNGRVIMLMSPVVNALTPAAQCKTQGYVAGFFEEEDLGGGAGDPNSNNGEIFYSIVPDPVGVSSCTHSVADVGSSVPATFTHELQHLISFSQHVIVHGGNPETGWLDEGLSIVAEELGSVYYEQKCPGTACRSDPAQLFPDSAQGFIQGFLYDSYEYALLPDTASVTLHSDADDGFSWRGGDWLLMRWLGDQMGSGFYKKLETSSLIGISNIESAAGTAFPSLFANFGLALVTDSLPSLPRATAPAVDRFTSRNMRQLWARLYTTSGGASDIPLAFPVQLFAITADTSTAVMNPGTMSFFRLDTPASASTVSIQYSAPGGVALPAALRPQLAIFRLPPGQ